MRDEPPLHIVLYRPEIPQNTGNVGRLCVALELRLHVVHPVPFQMDEKAVRRAGLDYWKHVDLVEHVDEAAFWAWADGRRVLAYSSHAEAPFTAARHAEGDVLLFGCESVGLPKDIVARLPSFRIPMTGPVRSINLASAVTLGAYEGMRQVRPALFGL